MSGKILQVNFKFNVPRTDYEQAVSPMAGDIAAVPGLRWKVWLMNEAESEAGGILHFDDEASLQAYLDGPIVAAIMSHPALSDHNVKQFDIMDDQTAVTRGPVKEKIKA